MTQPLMRLTTAGRAAMVNVQNTGTAAIQIAQIGVTAQSFVASTDLAALPGEFKRLITFAGDAVADDTIHVTLRDDSSDQYALRGFGLYSNNGVLIATYCGAEPIMEKSAQAMLLLAVDGRIEDGLATSLTFGETSWMNPPATTSVQGVVELADDFESITGTDSTRAVPPSGLKAAFDARIGAGAPSPFVKVLLTKATAVLFRAALEIKSAALRDEGEGFGLDADLLDGKHGAYYRRWDSLTGVPGTFPPDDHRTKWADIDGLPGTATRWPTFQEVQNKPLGYPPEDHTHAAASITSGVLAVARIPDLEMTKVKGLEVALSAKAPRFNPQFTGTGIKVGSETSGESVIAFGVDDFYHYSNTGAIGIFSTAKGPILQIQKSNKWAEFYGTVAAPNFVAMDYGNNGGFFRVGNDLDIIDVGVSNTAAVRGQQDPSKGYLMFGNSNQAFGWDGARLMFGPWEMWNRGNFDPNTKASINATVTFADIYAYRGNGTGVVFLGRGDRYIHWDGGKYHLPGGPLTVDGGTDTGSSRKLKHIEGPLPYGLSELRRIKTVIGSYRADYLDEGPRRRLFVIAEQLRGIIREAVRDEAIDFKGEKLPAVDYTQIIPLLIVSVQQLADQFDRLENTR